MGKPFRNRSLPRRTFLRGAGACIALPWLDAMVPALRAAGPVGSCTRVAPPLRAVFVFAPNGKKMDDWRPPVGSKLELPFLLEPLAPLRDQVTVFSKLALDGGRAHGDGPGDHARAAASFLTCAHPYKTGGADIRVGVSIDQVIAESLGSATPLPSLELGMEGGRSAGACDSGYSCAYSQNIAWRTPNTPVAKETSPRAVFARLFGDPDAVLGQEEKERQRRRRRSVLDAVLEDARSLSGRLGSGDRAKLEEYLTAVRELEERLQHDEVETEVEVPDGIARPEGGFVAKLDLMYEMIVLALRADLTRVVTFMLGNAGSNRSYRFLEVPEGHHSLSHHGRNPQKLEKIRRINRFHVERFAEFLARLLAVQEEDGDLLGRSLVLYGSGLADGNAHAHHDLPVLLAGGSGAGLRGDRHLDADRETPMANLYLAIAQRLGVPLDTFADSTAPLAL